MKYLFLFLRCSVRSKGLEPLRLLGTTTSNLRVYQFHHDLIILHLDLALHGPYNMPCCDPT